MMVEVRIELDAKFLIYQPDYTERQYQYIAKHIPLCQPSSAAVERVFQS